MSAYDRLPDAVTEIFGEEATAERAYDLLTVDVPAGSWIAALEIARDGLGCTYFDWLSAVDEPGTGFRVCAHVVALGGGTVRRLLIRTTVPHAAASLPSAVEVYAGAAWHERETYEMFGVTFTDHPHLVPLLLPEGFEGHPLRKDFVLAARVAKAWPGAKEPGESEHGGPKRRQMLPPGVPDPNEWGPLKGQHPPAPARPARAARTAGAPAAPGERPPRRTRSVAEGAASQEAAPAERPPRRTRSVSEGSASQAAAVPEVTAGAENPEAPAARPRRARTASEGSASQQPAAAARPGTPDAPWHHARPAFDESATAEPASTEGRPTPAPEPKQPAPAPAAGTEAPPAPEPEPQPDQAVPAPEPEQPVPATGNEAPSAPTAPAPPTAEKPATPAPQAAPAAEEQAPSEPTPDEPERPEADEAPTDSAERPGGGT
ncbi:NADH-quinone oxidoreductase subunit C [Streptomyces sp. NBC_01481]|uniref:NADH-quinone oxidoreductase subunit C n=1 Tax=Streptomyces sp. NBC_01481 TaxID=2975869 RepID=UPI002258DBF4|nr:NADH-quinone oxidoreductase subunit C [Streptomyces sp. NBC_01481]MCX4583522.1 NADH-quinone oxidoreductase subunit C [Streptomyces sp. NBC_01481]